MTRGIASDRPIEVTSELATFRPHEMQVIGICAVGEARFAMIDVSRELSSVSG